MRGRVDAARQAGDDAVAYAAEFGGERPCHLDTGQRGVAGADDGSRRQPEHRAFALDREQRRRVVHAFINDG